MCNISCIEFGQSYITDGDVLGKKVIEVGSYDVNGSLRTLVEKMDPKLYLGVDIAEGPNVDEICDVNDLITSYGKNSFDLVVTTELMEHIRDWRNAIYNLKNLMKPNGVLLLTTRSIGFHYHGYPSDFWRFEVDDVATIFSDLSIEVIKSDPLSPGVFVKAKKPSTFFENNLENHDLYSIIRGRRCRSISEFDIRFFKVKYKLRSLLSRLLPTFLKTVIKNIFKKED